MEKNVIDAITDKDCKKAVITNADKFIEIFGQDLKRQCSTKSWWEQEYIPPIEM